MGESGSGNRRAKRKITVEECLRISSNRWMRLGILRPGSRRSGSLTWPEADGGNFTVRYKVNTVDSSPSVQLSYSWVWGDSSEEQSAHYTVRLTTTQPYFGGMRWWFVCPLGVGGQRCKRRVGKLYLPERARHFGCRHCHRLTYTTCQESHQRKQT
jgi:hypothetical protein